MVEPSNYNYYYEYSKDKTEYRLYVGDNDDYLLTVNGDAIPSGAEVMGGRYPNLAGLKILHALWENPGKYVPISVLISKAPKQRENAHGKSNPESRIRNQLTYLRNLFKDPRVIEYRAGEVTDEVNYRFNGTVKYFRLSPEPLAVTGVTNAGLGAPATATQLEGPGGAIDLTSQFYIERACDRIVVAAVSARNFTMAIKGPRQVGKSSLLIRIQDTALKQGKQVAYIDFQTFDKDAFAGLEKFLIHFSSSLSYELGLEDKVDKYWPSPSGEKNACRKYVKEEVLKPLKVPLVLLLDEVDMIFHTSFCDDFFGMLRAWHNERARSTEFHRLDMAIVTSTEPKLFISDPNQSPFNVAEPKIEPEDFTPPEVEELNRRYGTPLNAEQLRTMFMLLGGHPYLTRLFLHMMVTGLHNFDYLKLNATSDVGPFSDHLHRLRSLLEMKSELNLGKAYLDIIKNNTCRNEEAVVRLKGAGLIRNGLRWAGILSNYFPEVRRSSGRVGEIMPRCELYANYFRRCLND